MKKFLNFFVLAGVLAIVVTSCYKEDIENLQKQIDALKSGEIATIETQISSINTSITELKSVDNTLKEYITALQSDGKKYAQQIADLTAMDKTLEGKITDLQKYVDSEIKDTKDWADATFATLDQMDSVSTVVAAVVVAVNEVSAELDSVKKEVTGGYTKAIEAATTKLEESMKKWVSEQLADYYTIAQINATLDSLGKFQSKVDSSMVERIKEQQVALDTAKSQITAAYKKAIQVAIDSLGGKFDTQIATQIATAKNALQTQITAINTEITNIKSRLATAENNIAALINRIQSIVVIPSYSDGSVKVISCGYVDTISFDVKPAAAAQSLADAWKAASTEERTSMVSFKIKEVQTKGMVLPTALIDTVFFKDAELKVGVKFENLPANAMTSLHIASGATDVASQFFGLTQTGIYFYFEAVEAGAEIGMTAEGMAPSVSLEYSTDDGENWNDFTVGSTSVALSNVGDRVYLRAKNNNTVFADEYFYNHFTTTKKANIGGNIMYLLNGETPGLSTQEYAFNKLFAAADKIISASNLRLSATSLAVSCYSKMFYNCSSLVNAPTLTAETLIKNCYGGMFEGCIKLSSVTMLATDVSAKDCLINWLKNAGEDASVTSRTLTINSSLNPNATDGTVKTIKDNSAGWDITNGVTKAFAYEKVGWGIPITTGTAPSQTTTVWAPVNCGYDATNYKYGKLYQFGRAIGGGYNDDATFNEDVYQIEETSASVSSTAKTNPDDNVFYIGNSSSSYDWYITSGTRLSSWPMDSSHSQYKARKIANPCPEGWRVPTESELTALMGSHTGGALQSGSGIYSGMKGKYFDGSSTAVPTSGLFLPAAGCRDCNYGSALDRGSIGYYWSSSVNGLYARYLGFLDCYASMSGYGLRAIGCSVRCVQK